MKLLSWLYVMFIIFPVLFLVDLYGRYVVGESFLDDDEYDEYFNTKEDKEL
jgi:hypothetical protein